ncbi:Acyl-CoA synthetase (AMP-forming)/AMP-acid ligase II [Parafrankia irregularis]|uniref:Acyl-CoA synthetase (AMP-forming)/AMP-acid ligase II n=1 Tax=Parafrankia irregularis TaxID=795642 RepID=A0A0S4QLZ0_9ACTN|nr:MULTISPECIES: AMP-binding protein [Parafrankia]MBE3200253.1 AMP-binding protein [Parafrankia sp. CH37]CUU56547.1 Acyl-CoA synthetase (AMP-forming)/AMP-acid ligase II [Parafrankia irregularis]
MTTPWTLTALWQHIATLQPHTTALVHRDLAWTWAEFDTAAAAVADDLRLRGVAPGQVVALCLPNVPEHLVSLAAVLRLGATPAQLNPRHRSRELDQLLRLLRPAATISDPDSGSHIAALHASDRLREATQIRPLGAHLLLVASAAERLSSVPPRDESTEHIMIKCTGGTTGTPQAVAWRVVDILTNLNAHNPWARHDLTRSPARTTLALADARIVVASPLSHGSGLTRALGALCAGGMVITVPGASYDPAGVLDAVIRHRADTLAIVGDAYARPLIDIIRTRSEVDLSTLRTVTSSGAPWTTEAKTELLALVPHLRLVETFGATEATGLGSSLARSGQVPATGHFDLGRHAQVFGADGTPTRVGEIGRVAVHEPLPAGIHPQGALPADRYVHSDDGRTYLLSGDLVRLLPSRKIELLGRGQDCINTGGEKVYAPEVAAALLAHPHVADAAVLAVPDTRLGSAVGCVLQLRAGGRLAQVLGDIRGDLAGYKIPRVVRVVAAIPRTPAGKVDLVCARQLLGDQEASS